MKTNKILFICVVAIVAVFFNFMGCSKQQKASEGAVTLRFIDVSPSPARQAYYNKVFQAFKAETGITVNYESVPWDDAANKLTVLGTSNSLPDVMTVWEGWLGQFTQAGWVVSLEQYIAGSNTAYTDMITKKLWPKQKNLYGSVYTVPDGLMVKGIFVRKDWARDKGITLDLEKGWTYDEYFNAIAKYTDPGLRHFGVSYRGARGAFDPILNYLLGFTGGRLYADDGTVLINSPECQEAFVKWTDLYLKGYAPKDSINWGFTEMVDNFTGGLTGTLLNDSEVAATCQESMQPDQWTVMPIPRSKDGKIYNAVNAPYSYSISTHSKNPDAAWKLIEFLNRPDNSIEYCKMGGLIPVVTNVANDALYGLTGPYSAFVRQLNDPALVIPVQFGPFNYTDLHQGLLHEEVQKYLLGQQDAKTSLNNISRELEIRMKKYLADNPGAVVERSLANF